VFARPRAGDVEQSAFSFVDIVQLRFVRGVGDALIEWLTALVTGHHDDCTKFQTLGQAHLRGHHLFGAHQTVNCGPANTETIPRRSSSVPSLSRRTVGKSRSAARRICCEVR